MIPEPERPILTGFLSSLAYLACHPSVLDDSHKMRLREIRHLLARCGYALPEVQEHLDKHESIIPRGDQLQGFLDEIEPEDLGNVHGIIDGLAVTHAVHVGSGWLLYHYKGDSEHPTAEEMTQLHGWPDAWPPIITGKWLVSQGVTLL